LQHTRGAGTTSDEIRTYLSAQRTLLAWIRTAVALMGFGFLVARFGLFVREMMIARGIEPARSAGWSLWIGTTLVILGAAMNSFAAARHIELVRSFRSRELSRIRRSWFELGLSVILALVGLVMAYYLLLLGT